MPTLFACYLSLFYHCIHIMTREIQVYLVLYRNSVIYAASNLKTAYDFMMDEVPPHLKKQFKSYAQVLRIIKKGKFIGFPIPDRDYYYIKHMKVHTSFKPVWVGSAGVQPARLRPTDQCGSQLLRG